MRILIYGSSGWIGAKLVRLFAEDDLVIHGKARVDSDRDLERELAAQQPDRVVCCIGRTHGPGCGTIDYLEQPGRLVENVRDNLYSPLALALRCQAAGVHLTYLGTGCIFESGPEAPTFDESSEPNFFGSSYSVVKGFTDRLLHRLPGVLNVRIRMPITDEDHPRNFITKITSYEKICSVPNSMTVLDDLLPLMVDMCRQGTGGTVNLCNPGTMSHNEILEIYRDTVDPTFRWSNFSTAEQDQLLAAGRSNNEMDTTLLRQRYPAVPDLRTSVTHALQRMAARRQGQYENV